MLGNSEECRSTFALHAIADAVEIARAICVTIACCQEPFVNAQELQKREDNGKMPIAIEVCTDCRSVFDALSATEIKAPSETSLVLILNVLKELLQAHVIKELTWLDTKDMLADGLTKGGVSRLQLFEFSSSGKFIVKHVCKTFVEAQHVPVESHASTLFAQLHFRPYD